MAVVEFGTMPPWSIETKQLRDSCEGGVKLPVVFRADASFQRRDYGQTVESRISFHSDC